MPWSTDDLKRLVEVEAHLQGVDPRLALAVVSQESAWNPNAERDGGRSIGLFQLQEGAAKDAGLHPRFRRDVPSNITAGVTYLKQKLAQSGGNVEQALARYNRGTPDYRGIGDPNYVQNVLRYYPEYQPPTRQQGQSPGLLARVGQALSPASAEAATPQAAPRSRLEEIEAELARRDAQPPEGVEPPPAPTPSSGASQGPYTAPGESQPSDLVIAITKPSTPQAGPASSTRIEPVTEGGVERLLAERRHEAGIPLSAVPAIAVNTLGTVGGAALGALTSPVTGPIGPAAGAALGGALATRANTALGLAPQEKPVLETPYANVYPSDLLGAIPLGIAGATSALKGTVRNLPGANVARHEIAAERLGELGQRTAPVRPSAALFTEASQQGGAVPTRHLWRTSAAVVREEQGMQPGFRNTEAIQAGRGLLALMRQHGGRVPLGELEAYRQRLGQKIGTTTDQAELRRLRQIYAALHSDLEQAAQAGTVAGAGTLREAIKASRREHAYETLTDLWSPGKGLQTTAGDRTQVYGKRIQNQFEKRLTDDHVFAGSFTPAELTDIRATLRDVSRLTRITNPEAQGTVGSTLKWLGRLGGAGYGATTGDLLTGGAMILATEGASAVLARAMQSPVGRLALREAIREGNGRMTYGSLSAIAALLAREAAPDAPAPAPTP